MPQQTQTCGNEFFNGLFVIDSEEGCEAMKTAKRWGQQAPFVKRRYFASGIELNYKPEIQERVESMTPIPRKACMNTFLSKHLLMFGAGLLCIATASPVAAANDGDGDGTNSQWLTVGDQVPDLNAFPTFTGVDGKLQPVTQVKNDRHRLALCCQSEGEELAFTLAELAEPIEASKRPGIQTCVIFSATLDDVSRVMEKRIPLTKKTYAQMFSGALLVAAGRKTAQLGMRESLPKFADHSSLGLKPDEVGLTAVLFSKEGIIEWMGDITWADRPMDQLIAGEWDRSVTEMASRFSESLFFDMMFFAYYGDPESNAQFQPQDRAKLDATINRHGFEIKIRNKDGGFELNYAKPLLRCFRAAAKGERDTALRLLAESTLAVNCRLLTFDQYWRHRSAVSFLAGLRTTLATNAMLIEELKDSETKAKLQAQRQSLDRWVAILQAAEEGNFKKTDSLIAALPEDEVKDNALGILRCRIEACLASSLPDALSELQKVLEFKDTVRDFDVVVKESIKSFDGVTAGPSDEFGGFAAYITNLTFARLLDQKPVPDGIQPFLEHLQSPEVAKQHRNWEMEVLHFPDD